MIRAKDIVHKIFPPDAGEILAQHVLEHADLDQPKITIDMKGCPPAMLISSFFGGFRYVMCKQNGHDITKFKWETDYAFQLDAIKLFTEPHK